LPKEVELAARLQAYLAPLGIEGLIPANDLRISDLSLYEKQGLSNKTYLLRVEVDDGSIKDLILRLCNGSGKKASREYGILSLLWGKNLAVPKAYILEPSGKVLGKPFIIMERIMSTDVKDEFGAIDAAARSLAEIHGLDPRELEGILRNSGSYPEREFGGLKALIGICAFSTFRLPTAFVDYWRFVNGLERSPVEGRSRLIHGDFGFDNTIYNNGRSYVVDWENAEVAEPTFDVAYAYNFLDFDDESVGRSGDRLSERFLRAYRRFGGDPRDFEFYRRLAALKLLILIDALTYPGLISLLIGRKSSMQGTEAKLFLRKFRTYLSDVMKGLSAGW
jgi:aminoglycoside phosphotransferase (APT) family kinase protein